MTAHPHRLAHYASLPDRYRDQQVAAATVDAHGRVVTLLVPPGATCHRLVPPEQRRPCDALVVVTDGSDVHEVHLPELDLHSPRIDALGDGFVLVAARCRMPSGPPAATFDALEREIPHNALVVGGDGAPLTTFHAGDDVQDLLTDEHENIWTGYGDQGVVCAQLPARRRPARSSAATTRQPASRMTMSMPGLIRWTRDGSPAWYATFDPLSYGSWVDCYALNVGADRAWAYPYTGFPLVEIDAAGIRWTRRTPVHFASAVLIDGEGVAFLAADSGRSRIPGHYTVTRTREQDGVLEPVAAAPLLLPDGTRPDTWARRTVCRGDQVWLQFPDDRTWYRIGL
ncbi:hypothetical protein [Streptacidiphilus jiangxiensis]|uniref:Uncharacterized protein n=1 Tax=Streptacidiphilus jiangxiensis TaxID=235985 RepID=A0A1H7L919_STRJI|nr:hypothetical protein [Streptacidiphilus jiangxiensis]SEK95543.1 hypothetical protein SAMN05414137_104407 [Streptacidiphilus jiangxiensis]